MPKTTAMRKNIFFFTNKQILELIAKLLHRCPITNICGLKKAMATRFEPPLLFYISQRYYF